MVATPFKLPDKENKDITIAKYIACGSCQLQINSEENYYMPLEEEMTTSINVAYHTNIMSSSRLLSNSMNLDRSNLQLIVMRIVMTTYDKILLYFI